MGFLKPFLVLVGLLIVAKMVSLIIAGLAVGIFLILVLDNFAPGSFPSSAPSYDDD